MDANTTAQTPQRVYFRTTTTSQRQFLFSSVEETDNVSESARRAHVGRGTYYYWQSRYESEGIAGLSTPRSRTPHHTRIPPIRAELREEVLTYSQAHPTEGYQRVTDRICQAHGYEKVIGRTKVSEILLAARAAVAPVVTPPVEADAAVSVVHAPHPNQTLNIDLCVVPCTHDGTHAMTSVSLNAAAAGVAPTESPDPPPSPAWPGQIFENTTLSYEEQMRAYVEQRAVKRASKGQRQHRRRQKQAERAELNAQSDQMRLTRRRQRAARRSEDAAWKTKRGMHQTVEKARHSLSHQDRRERRAERRAQQAQWQANKAERHVQVHQRQEEDAQWRQTRQDLRSQLALLTHSAPLVTAWLAILVVVDNGTRRCLGLPLFTAGVHVTADMIVAALRAICPPELQFMISDNGPQFIAEVFAQFAQQQTFLHVRIAPHRPCSNGIAERFVLTLKQGLDTHAWNCPEELEALLIQFIEFYNDRPHQGAELDGLSPNEFARRLADCSRC
jgi:transposase InsO family protein